MQQKLPIHPEFFLWSTATELGCSSRSFLGRTFRKFLLPQIVWYFLMHSAWHKTLSLPLDVRSVPEDWILTSSSFSDRNSREWNWPWSYVGLGSIQRSIDPRKEQQMRHQLEEEEERERERERDEIGRNGKKVSLPLGPGKSWKKKVFTAVTDIGVRYTMVTNSERFND